MARVQTPQLLSQISLARSYSEQAAALRALKDDITGHVQRKEGWIEHGVLDSLVMILQNDDRPARSAGKERSQTGQPGALAEDEVVRLLALQLLASFAYGGAAFLGPLHTAGVVPALIPAICPANNPPQIVLAALRTVYNITASTEFVPKDADDTSGIADLFLSSRSLGVLCAILTQDTTDAVAQEQKRLVASLISKLCKGPHHQNALAESGALDALATMLASFVVARGEVVPGAEVLGQADGLAELIPGPAPPGADLALVLEALSTVITNSRFRSCMFLCSPAILAVFPSVDFTPPTSESRAAWDALELHGFGIRARTPGAIDHLLPAVPIAPPKPQMRVVGDYPPLGFTRNYAAVDTRVPTFKFTGLDRSRFDYPDEDEDADEPESPLIPWLIHLVRSTDGLERVMAASLLTSLFKAGFASPEREQALAVLVVPLLCQLLKEHDKEIPAPVQQAAFVDRDTAVRWAILERTLDVLARLVGESENLQQLAHVCDAIKLAVKFLKGSYEPHSVQTPARPWSPAPRQGVESDQGSSACRLGPPGRVPAYAHRIKMRENALKLMASMATLSNSYRQALVEADVAAYVLESLTPSPGKPKNAKDKPASERDAEMGNKGESPYGDNPNTVIMAACHVTRALSRLPSLVRTTLQDYGFANAINRLLRHPDVGVQTAASSAAINLVTNCSPMVQSLVEAGIVRTLCEHAHSLNAGLRLNALWALKHLVVSLDMGLRKQCLEELEPGWLVQLISDDTPEEETLHSRSRSERRGTDADEDEDMDAEALYEDDSHQPWTWPALRHITPAGASARLQQASAKLAALHDAELNPTRRARNDSLAIQEQGLGFIRNLIMVPDGSNQSEMIDYLFTELGQDRVFTILADKLKVRIAGAFSRRSSHGRDALVLYPQARIVENLTYILVHMAAGAARHRQLVVAQTGLLQLLGGHLNSKDAGVRRALCQLFMNLSCLESDGDRQPCAQRASELKRLGFLTELEGLGQGDADLAVRERARAAVAQMKAPTA